MCGYRWAVVGCEYLRCVNSSGSSLFPELVESLSVAIGLSCIRCGPPADKSILDRYISSSPVFQHRRAGHSNEPTMASRNGLVIYGDPAPPSTAQIQMKSRELLVDERMHSRMKDYVDVHPYLFFVGTWNVNGQIPTENVSLEPWLSGGFDGRPHFYILGFQELDLDKRAYVIDHSIREEHWAKAVQKALKKKGIYKLVSKIRLVGIMLLVYVMEDEFAHIRNVAASYLGTGIMGFMGNKGGVGVRLDFHETELCFVTAHFAAHTEEVERRNEDFRNIWSKLIFVPGMQLQSSKKINDHDVVLFCGDFNYRIARLDRKAVEYHLTEKLIEKLFSGYDQLQSQMSMKKVFHGFSEGKITFRPTYKYDTGSDEWDSSEKFRVPSWCDRILWKSKEVDDVKQVWYDSRMQLQLSDHKPVVGLFQIGIKVVDPKRKKKVYDEVLKNIDREENLLIPSAVVEQHEFDFGDVTFAQSVTKQITLTNKGQVPFMYEFVVRPNAQNYCKDWLKISPERDTVSVNQVQYIDLVLEVDKKSASKLTAKDDILQDILVLRLVGGRDIFITIDGNYVPSCFGMALNSVAETSVPVRSAPPHRQELLLDLGSDAAPTLQAVQQIPPPPFVPIEIWMLIVQLHIRSADIPDLFLQPGLPDEVEKIRDHLDGRLPLPLPGSGHSVAEALLLYLDALPDPLVPAAFYSECLEAASSLQSSRTVLQKFSKAHRATFIAFIALVRELQKHWQRHATDEGTLEVIADLVLRTPPETKKPEGGAVAKGVTKQLVSRRKTQFLQHFLQNRSSDEPVLPRTLNQTIASPGDVFQPAGESWVNFSSTP